MLTVSKGGGVRKWAFLASADMGMTPNMCKNYINFLSEKSSYLENIS